MRRLLVVLAVLGAVALALTWLVQPNLLLGLRSPRTLAWTAALGVVCLLVGLLARRLGASPVLAVLLALVPGLVATALVVVRPVVDTREVSEALPSVAPSAAAPSAAAAPSPARVATGTLRGLAGHSARGRVSTYRLADGSHVVRFEGVDIGGTPDPEVYVLSGSGRTGKSGGTHLGALKAEKGSFNYVLPAALALRDFTVLVWCERFGVDIAHATQA